MHPRDSSDVLDGFGETMEPLDIDDDVPDGAHLLPVVPPLPVVPHYPRRIHFLYERCYTTRA